MRRLTRSMLHRFLGNESGATAIEYALLAAGVAGAIIATVIALGTSVLTMYQNVSDSLN